MCFDCKPDLNTLCLATVSDELPYLGGGGGGYFRGVKFDAFHKITAMWRNANYPRKLPPWEIFYLWFSGCDDPLSLCSHRPYSVTPSTATLGVNACMQATISFIPKETGEHAGQLVLHYSTGEKVYTTLYGNANDVNVRLDRTAISLDSTFIGLSSQR